MGKKSNLQEFISKFRNKFPLRKYDFSKSVYISSKDKIKVICPIHGEFWIRPNDLLNGTQCPKCVNPSKKYTNQDFINKANTVHSYYFDYSKVNYIDSKTKVCIICPEHGEFWQTPAEHLRGSKCPLCKKWKLEEEIKEILLNNNFDFKFQYKPTWLKHGRGQQSLDFYIPKLNIAIECQGKQHFGIGGWTKDENVLASILERDKRKYDLCKKHNITILYYSNLHIKYSYNVIEDKESLLKLLQND